MPSLKAIRKNVKNTLMFPADMYNNTLGSVIVCAYILGEKKDLKEIAETWKKIVKKPELVNFWIDDEKFIDKCLALFDMEKPAYFPVAMVQSELNCLFMPYIDEKLLPLREDGVYPRTAEKGKIYPIVDNLIKEG